MGLDINVTVQVKQNDKWETVYLDLDEMRDYRSFALLAGVRNDYGFTRFIAQFDLPEGFKKSNSEYNDFVVSPSGEEFYLGDWGTFCFTFAEMVDFQEDYSSFYLLSDWYNRLKDYADYKKIEYKDIYVIFAFS